MAESAQDVRQMALGVLQSRLMDSRQLTDEFETVLARDYNIRHSSMVAQAPPNSAKNRYVNVLPYDHNRVLLRPCSAGANPSAPVAVAATGYTGGRGGAAGRSSSSSHPESNPDYINASHILHDDVRKYGFSLRYIACQGPLASTVPDFWRMCWSEGVGAVVMLTNTTERGVAKCSQYFPAQAGARLTLRGAGSVVAAAAARLAAQQGRQPAQHQGQQHGGASDCRGCQDPSAACVEEVAAVSTRQLLGGDLTETKLLLLPSLAVADPTRAQIPGPGPQAVGPREVTHLHYNSWPDHGTPADAAAIRTMCDLLRPVRAAGGAVVVHCSAGIGRTGTFCAIDILRHRIDVLAARADAQPGSVQQDAVHAALDLPDLVHSLRKQRGGMVQTIEQYAFCYQAVYEELAAAVGRGGGGVGGAGRRAGPDTPPRGSRR